MIDTLCHLLQQRLATLPAGHQYWIGLAGAPGSGKSTLTAALQMRLGDDLLVLPMDGYHLYRCQLDAMNDPHLAYRRRGAPFTFDAERCVAELVAARQRGEGCFPGFDHAVGDPEEGRWQLLPRHRLVLVEGNYLLLDQQPWCRLSTEVFDETWLLDLDPAISDQRVFERHCQLGLTPVEARQRVEENDGPNARLILAHSNADLLIREDGIQDRRSLHI